MEKHWKRVRKAHSSKELLIVNVLTVSRYRSPQSHPLALPTWETTPVTMSFLRYLNLLSFEQLNTSLKSLSSYLPLPLILLWIGLSGDLWDRIQWHTWDSGCFCPVQSEQRLWELRILSAAALHFPLLGQCPHPPRAFTKFVGCALWSSLVQMRCEKTRAVSLWYGSTRTLGCSWTLDEGRRGCCSHLK